MSGKVNKTMQQLEDETDELKRAQSPASERSGIP